MKEVDPGTRASELARRATTKVNIAPRHGFLKRHPIASFGAAVAVGQLGGEAVGNAVAPHAHVLDPTSGPHLIALAAGSVGAVIAKDVVSNSQWYQRRALARENRRAEKAAARVGRTLGPRPDANGIAE